MVRHVYMPGEAISSKETARRVTATHDWLTNAPVTTLPAQSTWHSLFLLHTKD